jgi:NAD(P)-dependent dehydrogenase (short-subunit alcohol dehydrogenase family)
MGRQEAADEGAAMMKSVIVTGASTGIGHGAAKVLIDRGFRVFGSVRTQADADRLARELEPNFTPLLFDVTDERAVHASAAQVRQALGGEPLGLVNNAGIAVPGASSRRAAASSLRHLKKLDPQRERGKRFFLHRGERPAIADHAASGVAFECPHLLDDRRHTRISGSWTFRYGRSYRSDR